MKLNPTFKSKLYTYFIKRLRAFPYRNGWLKVPVCPYCGRELKMGINLSTFRTNCFRCNAHPSPIQLAMDVEGFTEYSELIKLLDNEDFTELTFKEDKVEIQGRKEVYLPEGFRNISEGRSQLARSMRSYIKKRGFSVEGLSKQGVGYCNTGKFFGYLIIPYTYHGVLRYYNARNVMGIGPRYNNPDKDTTGLGKEFIIFNHDALEMYESVYICEGALNALTLGERAIAMMGKAVSSYQINELLKSPVKRFTILLDPDAKLYAINLALKLVNFKRVKVVFLPEEKDVNDLGKKNTMKLVYKTRYQEYKDLIKLKNELV